jgi:hypothetical protein
MIAVWASSSRRTASSRSCGVVAASSPAREAALPLMRRSPVATFSWKTSPAGEAALEAAAVEVGQERPVGPAVPPDLPGVGVVDRPADVVVAADVRRPRRRGGLAREAAQARGGEPGVAGGQRRPELHHEAVVVGEVAHLAGVGADAEVGHELRRADDRLGLEDQRRRGDAGDRAQRLGDACTSGWFWQSVPMRFHRNAIASRRRHSTPWLARKQTISANSHRTSGCPTRGPTARC